MRLWKHLRAWSAQARLGRELAIEMQSHREMLEERFQAEGMSAREAQTAARRELGNDLLLREESRDVWGIGWLDTLFNDFKFAARLIRRQSVLSAAAVLTVALGVGANTAVMSVLETVLLHPLGLHDSASVLVATVRFDKLQMTGAEASGTEYRELLQMADIFSGVAAVEMRAWTLDLKGDPSRLTGRAVTPDFFRVFDERPKLGRFFVPQDREALVLSYRLWQTRFGGESSVLGRMVVLDGNAHRVVGVAGPDFHFPVDAEAWTPLELSPQRMSLSERGNNMVLELVCRLRPGVTPKQAAERVNLYVKALKSPGAPDARDLTHLGYFIDLGSFAEYVAGDLKRPLSLLWTASLVVLLAGCANVAALLLSRVASRNREIAIRLAVGATRSRILRQLVIESLLLGLLGGLFGIALASGAVSSITHLAIPQRELLELTGLDLWLMLYGLAISMVCGLVFGLVPALQLLRPNQFSGMRRWGKHRFQSFYVGAQTAAALVLLVGAGLLLRSLWAVEQVRPGFDAENLSTARLVKPAGDPGFVERFNTELQAQPGKESAALAYPLPFTGEHLTSLFSIEGQQKRPGEPEWHAEAHLVSPSFFETVRIPLLRGRRLLPSDDAKAPRVCVIDVAMAQRFFEHQDPIGQEIGMYGRARIVGVVGTIHSGALDQQSRPAVYYPIIQLSFFPETGVVVRPARPGPALIRASIRRTNNSAAVFDVRTMTDRIGESLGIRRVLAQLVLVFGAICLALATVGLNGVAAQMVEERGAEIGVRTALGARPGQILRQFLLEGFRAGAVGLICGLAVTAFAQRWLSGLLFEVSPFDPLTFATSTLALLAILATAVYWPARRASRINPQSALRHE